MEGPVAQSICQFFTFLRPMLKAVLPMKGQTVHIILLFFAFLRRLPFTLAHSRGQPRCAFAKPFKKYGFRPLFKERAHENIEFQMF